jgi:hypothetical protein
MFTTNSFLLFVMTRVDAAHRPALVISDLPFAARGARLLATLSDPLAHEKSATISRYLAHR